MNKYGHATRIQPPAGRRFVKGYGPKNAKVMFVGEAPGFEEDREGMPFVGKTGRELNRYCRQVGINLAQCYRTNVVKYRPEYRGAGAGNNAPTTEDIARDEHILIEEIETIRPQYIAALGRTAIRWFAGDVDVEDVHGLPTWTCNSRAAAGDDDALGTVAHFCLIPMYHPAAGLHSSDQQPVIFWDFQQLGAFVSGARIPEPVRNQYPNPDYKVQPWFLPEDRVRGKKLAVDTEGLPGRVWGLSYSHIPGTARVVLNEYGWAKKDVLSMMRRNRTIMHNSPHDIPILAEMFGITVEELLLILTWEGGFDDTMVKSYVLRLLPQGLKALELRLAGMISPSYMDVVRDADREIVVEYLHRLLKNKCHHCEGSGDTVEEPVSEKTGKVLAPRLVKCKYCEGDGTAWPPPPEQLVYEKGKVRISRGWPIGRRVRGILKDIDKIDPETGHYVNLRKRWETIDEEYRNLIEDVAGPMREVSLNDVKPPSKAIDYSAQDADATLRVDDVLDPMLDEFRLRDVYEIDRNAIPLIVQMMTVGTLIDRPYFAQLSQRLENECDHLLYKLERIAGHYVNPSSSMQVSELLFEKFRLDPIKETKSGGAYSTDDKVLEDLKLQVAARDDRRSGEVLKVLTYITDYRERHKLRSTYTESLPRKADQYDRIHTTFKITRTESGRISSTSPNLQNIPARSDLGKLVRAGFVPKPGCVLLACDFGQIEMRVLAHESRDKALIAAIRGGLDVHNLTTNKIFGIPIDKAKGTWQRTAAKCFHPDTEVLTRTGWKRIIDLRAGEEVAQAIPGDDYKVDLEWVVPTEVFTKKHPSQRLVHLQNQGMDVRVTPDHRMLGWTVNGHPTVKVPEEFNTSVRGWANSGRLRGTTRSVNEWLLRLAVAAQADGSVTSDRAIRFGFTKQRKIDRFKYLLGMAALPATDSVSAQGVQCFYVRKHVATTILSLLHGAKSFPWWWLELDERSREIVLDEVQYWDSHRVERRTWYTTTDEQSAEVLQAIASITGRKTRLRKQPPRGKMVLPLYHLTIRESNRSRSESLKVTSFDYTDEVACLSVPSSFVLVRDGIAKVPVVIGQTLGFGIVYGISAPALKAQIKLLGGMDVSEEQCQEWIDSYLNDAFPGIGEFMDAQKQYARDYGYVQDMFGRRRYLPGVMSDLGGVRSEAERISVNHPIQAGAGGIMKLACPEIMWDVLPKVRSDRGYYCEPLLTVHDEFVFEVATERAEYLEKILVPVMTQQVKLLVPMEADAKVGMRWSECK